MSELTRLFPMISHISRLKSATDALERQTDLNNMLAAAQLDPGTPEQPGLRQAFVDQLYPDEPQPVTINPVTWFDRTPVRDPRKDALMALPNQREVARQREAQELGAAVKQITEARDRGDSVTAMMLAVKHKIPAPLIKQLTGLEPAVDSLNDKEKLYFDQHPEQFDAYMKMKVSGRDKIQSPYDQAIAAMIAKHGPEKVGQMLLNAKTVPTLNYERGMDNDAYKRNQDAINRQLGLFKTQLDFLKTMEPQRPMSPPKFDEMDAALLLTPREKVALERQPLWDAANQRKIEHDALVAEVVNYPKKLEEHRKKLSTLEKEILKLESMMKDENQRSIAPTPQSPLEREDGVTDIQTQSPEEIAKFGMPRLAELTRKSNAKTPTILAPEVSEKVRAIRDRINKAAEVKAMLRQ